jgi:hypothetical protein
MKRLFVGLILVGTLLSGAVLSSAAAFASTTGQVHVFVDVSGTSATDSIILTGAIGDYGTSTSIDKNGKTDPNGNYVRIALKKGGFEINAVALGQAFNKVQPVFGSGCSGTFTASSPVTVFNGKGAYVHIRGTIDVTFTGAFIIAKSKRGKCNEDPNAQPASQIGLITGSGRVTFG